MERQKIYLMIGIPGSGKSTYAKHMMKNGDIYISRDEVRYSMITDNDEYFSKETAVFTEFVKRIESAIATGNNVWIDATHINPRSRTKMMNAIKSHTFNKDVIGVFLNTPFWLCKHRNIQREGRAVVPGNIMYRMWSDLIPPSQNETYFTAAYEVSPGVGENSWEHHKLFSEGINE